MCHTISLSVWFVFFAGKDSRIHVFRLIDFEGEQMESSIRSKNDIKDHKIERTKGKVKHHTYLYSIMYRDCF